MPGTLNNDRLLRALRRQPVDATPVWIMRQAGRYLPEYRALRQQAGDFMTLCKTPELACEATLQPLQRFDLDAAILFSDILTIPDAMGLGLSVVEQQGPRFARPLRCEQDIIGLRAPDTAAELGYVTDAVRRVKRELAGKVPLIGFAGSPWTLATYMIEGGSSKNFSRVKGLLYEQPALLHSLLSLLGEAVADYLQAQRSAGADALMIFDSWGGVLTTAAYRAFSLAYMRQIVQSVKSAQTTGDVPIILFTRGGGLWIEDLVDSGCDAIGVDWSIDLDRARARSQGRVALQGNLDTAVLYADATTIRQQVQRALAAYGPAPGHVFNLGHGIHPDIDPDNVAVLVDAVHDLSRPFHAGSDSGDGD